MRIPSSIKRSPRSRAWRNRTRRGAGTLEAIVAFPVLLIATLAIVQFGVQMTVQQTVAEAVNEGARAAAGETTAAAARDAAVAAVNNVLSVHNLAVSPLAALGASGSGVRLALEYPTGASVVLEEAGDSGVGCTTPAAPVLIATDSEVRLTLCVDQTASPLLNLLPTFGFDATGKRLQASALADKE